MAQSNPSYVSIIGPIQSAITASTSDPNTYTQALLEAIVILLSDIRQNIIEQGESRLFAVTELTPTL